MPGLPTHLVQELNVCTVLHSYLSSGTVAAVVAMLAMVVAIMVMVELAASMVLLATGQPRRDTGALATMGL